MDFESEHFYNFRTNTRLKNSISNTIRLDDKRKNLLKKYIRESQVKNEDLLFVSRKGNPISSRQLDRLMKHYAGNAKLPEDKAHWHTLKKSIAVHHQAARGFLYKDCEKHSECLISGNSLTRGNTSSSF